MALNAEIFDKNYEIAKAIVPATLHCFYNIDDVEKMGKVLFTGRVKIIQFLDFIFVISQSKNIFVFYAVESLVQKPDKLLKFLETYGADLPRKL